MNITICEVVFVLFIIFFVGVFVVMFVRRDFS
jgi:hypothetical protein